MGELEDSYTGELDYIFNDDRLTGNRFRVMCWLLVNSLGGKWEGRICELADGVGVSHKNIGRVVSWLCEKEYLERVVGGWYLLI